MYDATARNALPGHKSVMTWRKALVLALLLLAGLAPSVPRTQAAMRSSASPALPADIMTAIYREAVKTEGSAWLDPERRPHYLSNSLTALWKRADRVKPPGGGAGPIDFDITADTNGAALENFVVTLADQTDTKARVLVELVYVKDTYRPGPPAVLTYDFVRETSCWKIDGISTKTWSVRDLLTRWIKDGG
jgi:hypothetical protein